MRIGIVSDVHGDVHALDQALSRLRQMDSDLVVCAGDLLDVEPLGEEVVQLLKAEGVTCIRGNHERWAIERSRRYPNPSEGAQACGLGELADMFCGAELSDDALAWIASLPDHWAAEIDGVRVVMWHARPGSDMEGIRADCVGSTELARLLDQAGADVLVVGHTHAPLRLVTGWRLVVNAGTCCSRIPSSTESDDYRPSTFGVLDLPSKRFRVFRVDDGTQVYASWDGGG